MKKTLSIFVVLISMGSVVFAGGIDDPKASSKIAIVKKDENHFRLIYKSNKISNVEVAIYNDHNQLQFSEVIRKVDGFVRPYDFSQLANGNYRIVVKNQSEDLTESVKLTTKASALMAQVVKVKGAENKFLLMVSDKNSSFVTVQVMGNINVTMYEKRESINGELAKLFSFEGINTVHTFLVTDEEGHTLQITK